MKKKLFVLALIIGFISTGWSQQSREAHLKKMLHWPDILPKMQTTAQRPATNAFYRLDSVMFMDYDATNQTFTNNQKNVFDWYFKRNISYIPYNWDPTSHTFTHNQERFYTYVNNNSDDLSQITVRYDVGSGMIDYYYFDISMIAKDE